MKYPIVVLGSLMFTACGGATASLPPPAASAPAADPLQPTAPEPAPLSAAEAQDKTLTDYAIAWDAGDAQRAASFYADDAVIKLAGAPDTKGRDSIVGLIAANTGVSSDDKTPFTRLFRHGNVVIGEWIWAGTHSGDLMGLPPTHKPFGLKGVSVYFFNPKAKLEAAHVYFDMGTLMSQLGVSTQPARPVQALPTQPPVKVTSAGSDQEQRNLGLVRTLMGAFEKQSEADFIASMSDATTWDDVRQLEAVNGLKAAKSHFKTLTKAFPDAKIAVDNAWSAGPYVIVEGTLSGTHKGALGPIAATKRPVNLHFLDIIEFDADGRIVKGWAYGNSAEMAMQLGLTPKR